MTIYYFWIFLTTITAYFIITDYSVAQSIILLIRWSKIQYERLRWVIKNHPSNPIVKWLMWKRSWKIAKELQEEFNERRMD
jgi:hypothetical protein